jgi:predicted nucleic acid-binding protein
VTTTALDTNVLVDVLSRADTEERRRAAQILSEAAKRGPLAVCAVVYAELGAHPRSGPDEVDRVLDDLRIRIDWSLSESIWRLSGLKFREYAVRRRRSSTTEPRRLIADFIIGAHATAAGALATRDAAFYRRTFPGLTIVAY